RVLGVVVVARNREQDVPASQGSAVHFARLDAGYRDGHAVVEGDGGDARRRGCPGLLLDIDEADGPAALLRPRPQPPRPPALSASARRTVVAPRDQARERS